MVSDKVRLKDIARLAGVSIGTVDRVIHNRGEVADITLKRVQKIIKETNYSPNILAQVLKATKKIMLVSLLPEPKENNNFWTRHPLGIKRALEEINPIPVIHKPVTFDMLSEKDFKKSASAVISLKPDGVIIAPIFKTETIAFTQRLSREKIPFVFVDGYIEDSEFLAYIGEDIFRSGRVAAQLIDMVTPPDKDILIVTIARNIHNNQHLEKRSRGFFSYFSGDCINRGKRLHLNIPDPSTASISTSMDQILVSEPGIKSVFLTGSRSFLLARYLENKGISDIHLVGYDLLDENIEFLKKGKIRFLINQRPDEQTNLAVRKLTDFLTKRKEPDRIEYLPVDIVTSENIDFFVKNT
jgi:LacI family transcriptional regulator